MTRKRAKKHENKSNRSRILLNHCILSLHDTYISIRNLILFPIIYRNLSETVRKRTNRTISRCDLEQPSLIQSLGDLKVRDVHIHFIYLLPCLIFFYLCVYLQYFLQLLVPHDIRNPSHIYFCKGGSRNQELTFVVGIFSFAALLKRAKIDIFTQRYRYEAELFWQFQRSKLKQFNVLVI